jgi:hypothetical protein
MRSAQMDLPTEERRPSPGEPWICAASSPVPAASPAPAACPAPTPDEDEDEVAAPATPRRHLSPNASHASSPTPAGSQAKRSSRIPFRCLARRAPLPLKARRRPGLRSGALRLRRAFRLVAVRTPICEQRRPPWLRGHGWTAVSGHAGTMSQGGRWGPECGGLVWMEQTGAPVAGSMAGTWCRGMEEVLAREVLLLAGTLLRWAQEVWAAVVAGCAAGVVVVAEGRRAEAE